MNDDIKSSLKQDTGYLTRLRATAAGFTSAFRKLWCVQSRSFCNKHKRVSWVSIMRPLTRTKELLAIASHISRCKKDGRGDQYSPVA